MAKNRARVGVKVIRANPPREPETVTRSDTPEQLSEGMERYAGDWIEPPVMLQGLSRLVEDSSILPQCIGAYRRNIAGFGIGVEYKEDIEETAESEAEYTKVQQILNCLTLESDTKKVFEDIIESRETYGIAFLEVLRNASGEVVQIDFVEDTPSMRMTKPMEPYQEISQYVNGEIVSRRKKFKKYRQQVGGKTVYFKEFGDPRHMDKKTGDYKESIPLEQQANEIIEFKLGTKPYGMVRWTGQILGVDGSRKAETLNNNYFTNGRHTPLAILISGGTLTDDSYDKLTEYINDIRGEAGQHAFLLLETEATGTQTVLEDADKPKIEIKDLASILQKDELFQDYIDNGRRRVQSAFQLPDLYVGYTTDFNRATAQTAMEVTEEQVFQPERTDLAWIINNKLLNAYQLKYTQAYFKEPDISNPDDLYKLMVATNNAGGLTPNKAKELLFKSLGEISDDFEEEWGNIPLAYLKQAMSGNAGGDFTGYGLQMAKQIERAEANHDEEIIPVLRSIKKFLEEMEAGDEVQEKGD